MCWVSLTPSSASLSIFGVLGTNQRDSCSSTRGQRETAPHAITSAVNLPDGIVPIAAHISYAQVIDHDEHKVGFGDICSVCGTLALGDQEK